MLPLAGRHWRILVWARYSLHDHALLGRTIAAAYGSYGLMLYAVPEQLR